MQKNMIDCHNFPMNELDLLYTVHNLLFFPVIPLPPALKSLGSLISAYLSQIYSIFDFSPGPLSTVAELPRSLAWPYPMAQPEQDSCSGTGRATYTVLRNMRKLAFGSTLFQGGLGACPPKKNFRIQDLRDRICWVFRPSKCSENMHPHTVFRKRSRCYSALKKALASA